MMMARRESARPFGSEARAKVRRAVSDFAETAEWLPLFESSIAHSYLFAGDGIRLQDPIFIGLFSLRLFARQAPATHV